MNILLIDSSTRKIEFAYNKNGEFIILKVLEGEKNADSLIVEIRNVFQEKSISIRETDFIGLSNGPGSFTGLRIGSAVAKGLCHGIGCRLAEVITLDVLAAKYTKGQKDTFIMPLIFSSSRSGEFYAARYRLTGGIPERVSEYTTLTIDSLPADGTVFLLNEENEFRFPEGFVYEDISDKANSESLYRLALEKIKNGDISDFRTSEPFYMKKFVPKK